MKTFQLIVAFIALVALSNPARSAEGDSWLCVGASPRATANLNRLNLPSDILLREIGVLVVSQDRFCDMMHIMIYRDVCSFEGLNLVVGLEGGIADLNLPNGKTIKLICEEATEAEIYGIIGGSN